MNPAQLHNVTLYVRADRLQAASDFYGAILGEPVFEEPGHIARFGTAQLAVCVHEVEPGHAAGTRELFFWADDFDQTAAAIEAAGLAVQRAQTATGEDELRCVDLEGNHIRLHARPHSTR